MSNDQTASSPLDSTEMHEKSPQNPCKTLHSIASPEIPGDEPPSAEIDPNYRLSNAQIRAIQLALDGHRWTQIAQTLGINPSTLWRWKTQNPDFRNAFADANVARQLVAVHRTNTIAEQATSALAEIVHDRAHKDRVRAAQILLNHSLRLSPPSPTPPLAPDTGPIPEYPQPLITPIPPSPPPTTRTRRPEPELEPKVG
jgi:transposase-like protein